MTQQHISKTERIILTLGEEIVAGHFAPGAALPAESDLCDRFSTSRNIIREVFRALMAKRLIEVKRYRGHSSPPATSGIISTVTCCNGRCRTIRIRV